MNKQWYWGILFFVVCIFLLFAIIIYFHGDLVGLDTLIQRVTALLFLTLGCLIFLILYSVGLLSWKKLGEKDFLSFIKKDKKVKDKNNNKKDQIFFNEIKRYFYTQFGLFWRRKVRKCLVLGTSADVNILLPNLINDHWQVSDQTLMLYGGNAENEIDKTWLKTLKNSFGRIIGLRHKPLDAIIWLLPTNYLQLNRQQQYRLEKIAMQIRERNKVLGWQVPIYLVSTQASEWQQQGRIEQSIGLFFNHLRLINLDSVDPLLDHLAQECCEKGMQQVMQDLGHDFLLRLSRDLVTSDKAKIKQWLSKWLTLPKINSPRGLLFASVPQEIKDDEESYLPEHYLLMTPTWQTISDDSVKQSGSRIGVAWELMVCSLIILVTGIFGVGQLTSYYYNQELIMDSTRLVNNINQSAEASYGDQLEAQYALLLKMSQLMYRKEHGAPIRYQFALNQNEKLLNALWPHYTMVNERNIAKPFFKWQSSYLVRLTAMSPSDPKRNEVINSSYDVLKAYLMLSNPDKIDVNYLGDFASRMWGTPANIQTSQWQKLMPELVKFYGKAIQDHPELVQKPTKQLVQDVRQILINQIGIQNAENTIYQAILQRASQNYANQTLTIMLGDIDSRMLFSSNEEVPGVFTRKAWENFIKDEIANAAKSRQEQIDWVLSDSSKVMTSSVSPDVLRQHLTERYFSDYSAAWLLFLNNIQWRQANNVADVIEQLTLMSDVRQSPVIALMNVIKYHAEVAYSGGGLSDNIVRSAKELIQERDPTKLNFKAEASGPLTPTFGVVLNLMNSEVDNNGMSLQTYLLRVTQVRLKLQNITSSANPQAMAKLLAKSVFQGTSVDLSETRDYGNLIAANLGDEWLGFGYSLFQQPLEQAWQVILTPAAGSFNETWNSQIVYEWEKAFAGRYPFKDSDNDASLAELARFLRPNAGMIDKFISNELGGILEKQGENWVINPVNAQGLNFTPEFIEMLNLFNQLSNLLLISGDAQISFDLMARSGGNVMRSELYIDQQKLDYFNQMPVWQRFTWPGDGYSPYAQLSWSSDETGQQLYEYYSGDWAWIRLLESAMIRQIDSGRYEVVWKVANDRNLKYILRSQSGEGPLMLLKLRNFSLPKNVFDIRHKEGSIKVTL